jgi:hypothetical protein
MLHSDSQTTVEPRFKKDIEDAARLGAEGLDESNIVNRVSQRN